MVAALTNGPAAGIASTSESRNPLVAFYWFAFKQRNKKLPEYGYIVYNRVSSSQ